MPFSKAGVSGRVRAARLRGAFCQDGVNLVPDRAVNDRRVLAGIAGAFVDGITDTDPVVNSPVPHLAGPIALSNRH